MILNSWQSFAQQDARKKALQKSKVVRDKEKLEIC